MSRFMAYLLPQDDLNRERSSIEADVSVYVKQAAPKSRTYFPAS